MDIDQRKMILRREMQKLRDNLTTKEFLSRNGGILSLFNSLQLENLSQNYMSYVSIGNEVSTMEIIEELIKKSKKVSVPVCISDTSQLIASHILDLGELIPSQFGLLEPRKDLIRPVDPKELDIVVVPGLAFDRNLNRLGYGKGYYDRFLPNLSSKSLKIGLAYSFQIIEKVPVDDYDIRLDLIITEEEIITL